MWLLCLRRHVVDRPFPSPAVVLHRQLPFIQIQVPSLSSILSIPSPSLLHGRRCILFPWLSILRIPATRHLTAADALFSPGPPSSTLPGSS